MNEDDGTFAYGASDGSVGLITISQRLKQSDVRYFTPQFGIEEEMESTSRLIYQADGSAGIVLKWVPIPGRSVGHWILLIFYITYLYSLYSYLLSLAFSNYSPNRGAPPRHTGRDIASFDLQLRTVEILQLFIQLQVSHTSTNWMLWW